ncbi:MAG TPA: hypothetical protein VGH52_05190 [Gaiellaceae bacterium]|jgi:hypothetical protein
MPRILLAAGTALLAIAIIVAVLLHHGPSRATEVTVSVPARTTTTTTTTTATTTIAPPPAAPFSWRGAGAIVVHLGAVGPTELGDALRSAGFDWVALYLGGPDDPVTPDPGSLYRLRLASGLPVGGWSVLGEDPAGDAARAASVVQQDGLAFYIADAEEPYGYTDVSGLSGARYARSEQFVTAFRAAEPSLPAGLSSYCRPDQHDLDWGAWASAGFVFLPQAYVNDFGAAVSPSACVLGAAKWFAAANVHPTVGSYAGTRGLVSPARFVHLLVQAHTTGFSIYPAEVGMTPQGWETYRNAITALGIAKRP